MNDRKKVGFLIKPSARRSIHEHGNYCPFRTGEITAMGRYGLKHRPSTTGEHQLLRHEQDRDEVDNVMSKMLPHSEPPNSEYVRDKYQRSNSINIPPPQQTDDEDNENDGEYINIRTKSLPAIFPDHLHCSNNDENHLYEENSHHISHESEGTYHSQDHNIHNISSNSEKFNSSYEASYNEDYSPITENIEYPRSQSIIIQTLSVLIIFVGVSFMVYRNIYDNHSNIQKNVIKYDEHMFEVDMNKLGEKYNVYDDAILQIHSGVSTIIENNDTGSFILVYNTETNYFNPLKFKHFVNDIAYTASRYLRNDSDSVRHISIDNSNLDMKTHKELMNKYHAEVVRTGVMLVNEVDMVPSKLAMAFHYYCDEYNPLVNKSAIFFTLNIAKCSNHNGKKPNHAVVESCLSKKWNNLPADTIGPLLARVVNIVVDVTNVIF